MGTLKLKNLIRGSRPEVKIFGKGNSRNTISKAIIARTNLGLLEKAIISITEKKQFNKIYFEGKIENYTFAEEGTSLYDVLKLYNNNQHLIKDLLIKKMKDIDELEKYIDDTEDNQLRIMVNIVKAYGNRIKEIIEDLKRKQVDRSKAELIFSTVHKSKGKEYDSIELADDFFDIDSLRYLEENNRISIEKVYEEINILYVAITRTKFKITIPSKLIFLDTPKSDNIQIRADDLIQDIKTDNFEAHLDNKDRSMGATRSGEPWTEVEVKHLQKLYSKEKSYSILAEESKRTPREIEWKLESIAFQKREAREARKVEKRKKEEAKEKEEKKKKHYSESKVAKSRRKQYISDPWTKGDEEFLMKLNREGKSLAILSVHFRRPTKEIESKIEKLLQDDTYKLKNQE